jgi:hypothetical protein
MVCGIKITEWTPLFEWEENAFYLLEKRSRWSH